MANLHSVEFNFITEDEMIVPSALGAFKRSRKWMQVFKGFAGKLDFNVENLNEDWCL